jgi:arylsulfatase
MNRVCNRLALAIAAAICSPTVAAEPKPNILLIVADDLGYGEAGCCCGRDIPTPQLDSLAARGGAV